MAIKKFKFVKVMLILCTFMYIYNIKCPSKYYFKYILSHETSTAIIIFAYEIISDSILHVIIIYWKHLKNLKINYIIFLILIKNIERENICIKSVVNSKSAYNY